MDTKIMEQFHEMDITMLFSIEGGKNNWQTNVLEGGGAAFGCAAGGVKYGRLLGPWGAAIGGIGGAVVCGYLAYTATS